jgi:glucokinase
MSRILNKLNNLYLDESQDDLRFSLINIVNDETELLATVDKANYNSYESAIAALIKESGEDIDPKDIDNVIPEDDYPEVK